MFAFGFRPGLLGASAGFSSFSSDKPNPDSPRQDPVAQPGQLGYELGGDRDQDRLMLDNVNRLAGTRQHTLPVRRVLAHYVIDHMTLDT